MDEKGASLFPVAKGVQIPFVGGREILVNQNFRNGRPEKANNNWSRKGKQNELFKVDEESTNVIAKLHQITEKHKGLHKDKSAGKVSKQYLHTISSGLTFSADVVDERIKSSKPYSSGTEKDIFKDLNKHRNKPSKLQGRHDARCPVVRHYPCFLIGESIESHQFDIKHKPLPNIIQKNIMENSDAQLESYPKSVKNNVKRNPKLTWDERLMTLLSKETAELVIKEYTSGQQQLKLHSLMKSRERETKASEDSKTIQTNVMTSDNEHLDSKNATSDKTTKEDLSKKSKEKDVLYVKRMKQGAFPVHMANTSANEVVLDSDTKTVFGKVLEKSYPIEPDSYYNWQVNNKKSGSGVQKPSKRKKKLIKGVQKWKDYPEVIEERDVQAMTLSTVSPEQSSHSELDPKASKKQKEDTDLVSVVQEWRSRWFLEKRWESSSCEELLNGMNDINDHVRLSAVSACSKALLSNKIMETNAKERSLLLKQDLEYSSEVQVSSSVLEKVIELLSDRCQQVQVAAAITLYTLNKATQKAKEILMQSLKDGGSPEKWAAAQCLAHAGCDMDIVVNELISHIHSKDVNKHNKAVHLLGNLSKESTTVQCMVAEQLNSSSWRDRVVACQVFPSLQGPLSKDVANKISHLMWNDWSTDVRTAAARALGRTGNGKLVHDKLRDRLMNGNESEKLDALRKISFLGIMTGRILPSFLNCMRSDYDSIRLEAVKVSILSAKLQAAVLTNLLAHKRANHLKTTKFADNPCKDMDLQTCAAIRLSHEDIVEELLKLANEERNWKVKAHCIQAIGLVAKPTEKMQEILLWCLRYERVPAIRAEACRAICNLNLHTERVVKILQDRMVVEEDLMVQSEVASALNMFGLEPTGDLTMIKAIQTEVKRLCNCDNIAGAIVDLDVMGRYKGNKQKYLANDDHENSTKKCVESQRRASALTENGKIERRFDPILEGYKIRSLSQFSIPEIPNVEDPVLQCEPESGADESLENEDESLYTSNVFNTENGTIFSYSTATVS